MWVLPTPIRCQIPMPLPNPDPVPDPDPSDDPEEKIEEIEPEPANPIPTQLSTAPGEQIPAVSVQSQTDRGGILDRPDESTIETAYQGLFGSGSSTQLVELQYSAQLAMLERLLQVDLEQAIVWQLWDDQRDAMEESPISFLVGSAGTAAGTILGWLCSLGASRWCVNDGVCVESSRMADCRPDGAADCLSCIQQNGGRSRRADAGIERDAVAPSSHPGHSAQPSNFAVRQRLLLQIDMLGRFAWATIPRGLFRT